MAPLRRYIRLTPHTTLQTLIFLEDPSVLHTWLIHPTHPALPRIIASLKDLILPKLEEERDRERKSTSKKNRAVKDVAAGGDFEVSVFLKDGATKHALLRRRREFLQPKMEGGLGPNPRKMVLGSGAPNTGEQGNQIQDGGLENLRIENDDEEAIELNALPLADPESLEAGAGGGQIERQADIMSSLPPARPQRRTR